MSSGKLIIFSSPSGSGKSTIVNHLLKKDYKLEFSISATSRKPRGAEKHGKEYYFLSAEDFRERIENNEFLEWEEVYKDCFYGTLLSEVDRITSGGNNVVFDVDVIGGLNIKRIFGDRALAIFIRPPSIEELKNRLQKRNTDTQETIAQRVEKAEYEMSFAKQFDKIIVNDVLDIALTEAEDILDSFLKK